MKRTKLFIGALISIVLMLVVVQVVASNRISTAGIELGKLQTELDAVKRQNTLIQEKILTLSALPRIASKAAEMGYVEAKQTIYVDPKLPLARNQ